MNRLGDVLRHAQGPVTEVPKIFRDLLITLNEAHRDGDHRIFGEQLAALRPRLRSYARSLTRDPDQADDLVQDTMMRAWAARGRFEQGTNLKAWTHTILRNAFKSSHRRARFIGVYDEVVAENQLAHHGNQVATVELTDVARAMSRLSQEQQDALTLVAIEGLSYEEAAHRSGVRLGTLKSRVARARAAMDDMLRDDLPLASQTFAKPMPDLPDESSSSKIQSVSGRNVWALAKASNQTLWIG
ncbi:sigma-70 family RNA polymerase sigma factor [Sphingomonas sp. NFX23]|uniref:sigma-70 family RNA polymerase sigma factor n=1 Tax=Sphingomonas sp. NFX23 TaxID=2819532 RepID=UPI003CF4D97B